MSGKRRLSPGKSYRLLHYLNRQHSAPERFVLAASGYKGCLAVTGSPVLAGQLAREFWQDNFKDGLRRAHWYATRGWPGLGTPTSDPFFCFSEGLDLPESLALQQWLERRAGKLPELEAACARLVAGAQVVHQSVLAGKQPQAAAELDRFYTGVDALLEKLLAKRQSEGFAAVGSAPKKKPDSGREGDFAQGDAEQALKDVARLLPLSEWGWTALSGTFLGIYREGDFLPHDFDIDLGLLASRTDVDELQRRLQAAPEFESVQLNKQYRLYERDGELQMEVLPVLVKAVHRTGIAVDFSLLHEEDGVWWHGSMMHRWDHAPMDLIEYDLRGVTILGPRDGDRYLTEGYGDWRTPVKEFNCSSGRRNLMVVRNLLGVCLFMKRLIWHGEQGDTAGFDEVLADMEAQQVLASSGEGTPSAEWHMNRAWLAQ